MAVSKQEALGIISDINKAREPGSVTNRMVAAVLNYLAESLLTGDSVEDLAGLKNRMGNAESKLAAIESTSLPEIRSALSLLNSAVHGNGGLASRLARLENSLDTLTNGDTSDVIESFNEVVAFLGGVKDDETLQGILTEIDEKIKTLSASATEIDEKIKTLSASAMACGNVRFDGIVAGDVTFEMTTPMNIPPDAEVVWCERAGTFALRVMPSGLNANVKYYNSWGERLMYVDVETSQPYTAKLYILGDDIYTYDGMSLSKTGEGTVTKDFVKVEDYISRDVRILEVGKNYAIDEAVKTTDGKLLRMTKAVSPLKRTEYLAIGDLRSYNGVTYRVKKNAAAYNPNATYSRGDFAVTDTGAICIYNGSTFVPAGFTEMVAGLLESVDIASLERDFTEENTLYRDLLNYPNAVIIDFDERVKDVEAGVFLVGDERVLSEDAVLTRPVSLKKGDVISISASDLKESSEWTLIAKINKEGTYEPLFHCAEDPECTSIEVLYTLQEDCDVVFSFGYSIDLFNNTHFKVIRRGVKDKWFDLRYKKYYNNWLRGDDVVFPALYETFTYDGVSGIGSPYPRKRQMIRCKGGDIFCIKAMSPGSLMYWCVVDEDDKVIQDTSSLRVASVADYEVEIPKGGKYLVVRGEDTDDAEVYKKVMTEEESAEEPYEDISNAHAVSPKGAKEIPDVGGKFNASRSSFMSVAGGACHVVPVMGGEVYSLSAWLREDTFSGYAIVDYNGIVRKKVKLATKEFTCGEIIEIPDYACYLVYNTVSPGAFGADYVNRLLRIKRAKSIVDANLDKEAYLVAMQDRGGSGNLLHNLTFAWITDTKCDATSYRRFIDYVNSYTGLIDAALHTGNMNFSGDYDRGFDNSAGKYRPENVPFIPCLGITDAFGMTKEGQSLTSGSKLWNGEKYIKPFMDSNCVSGEDCCCYYRDFPTERIRVIVINEYDKPRWAGGDNGAWETTKDEAEISSAEKWVDGKSYASGKVVQYKGLYLKCRTEGILADDARYSNRAPFTKEVCHCRYLDQAQVDFIIEAMYVKKDWNIVFVGNQPLEPASEEQIASREWTCTTESQEEIGTQPRMGQNGYILQDLITAYLKGGVLEKRYKCLRMPGYLSIENAETLNMPDLYPDVEIYVDFADVEGDIICYLHGGSASDRCCYSNHCGDLKFLSIGCAQGVCMPACNDQDLYLPQRIACNDIVRGGMVSRDCFNIISFDTETKEVSLLRIGADMTKQMVKRDFVKISYAHNV